MNTDAIIEHLLLSEDNQLLSTPVEVLALSARVYRSLWRAHVRTIGDVARSWDQIMTIRNFGEGARDETLAALQAWFLSVPDVPSPDPAEDQATVRAESEAATSNRTSTDLENAEEAAQASEETSVHGLDPRLPIEVLHLSQRTYRALRRNHIDTIDDIQQEFYRIGSFRNVGRVALNEIRQALEEL